MPVGCEVALAQGILIGPPSDSIHTLEATFHGGTREVRGRHVAGAGATLWQSDIRSGLVERVAVATLALPGVCNLQEAEAWGARIAIDIVRRASPAIRRARVSGDRLAVVKLCASHGRFAVPDYCGARDCRCLCG